MTGMVPLNLFLAGGRDGSESVRKIPGTHYNIESEKESDILPRLSDSRFPRLPRDAGISPVNLLNAGQLRKVRNRMVRFCEISV